MMDGYARSGDTEARAIFDRITVRNLACKLDIY